MIKGLLYGPRNNICYSGHVKYFSDWLIDWLIMEDGIHTLAYNHYRLKNWGFLISQSRCFPRNCFPDNVGTLKFLKGVVFHVSACSEFYILFLSCKFIPANMHKARHHLRPNSTSCARQDRWWWRHGCRQLPHKKRTWLIAKKQGRMLHAVNPPTRTPLRLRVTQK